MQQRLPYLTRKDQTMAPDNAPHNALRRVVSEAIANGAEVIVEIPAQRKDQTMAKLVETRTVGYAYATSDIADEMHAADGGWFAGIKQCNGSDVVRYLRIQGPYLGKLQAIRVAVATFPDLEWDAYSERE